MLDRKLAQWVGFVEQYEDETGASLSIKHGYSEIRLLTSLMRNHLLGSMTTTTSLAADSGLSYGTAIRAIGDLQKRGLVTKRPRTSTGRSFSLHPTAQLIQEWQELSRRLRALVDTTIGTEKEVGESAHGYFHGASWSETQIIMPPTVLNLRLPMSGNLRVLVHADPTFMAMSTLKKQFENMFGVPIRIRALSIDRLRSEILKNAQRKTSTYDLVACDLPWFGELGEKNCLLPLDSKISEAPGWFDDFHPAAMASARYEGKQLGLPVQTAPELLVYRKDILQEKGIEPPTTIDGLMAAARRLHDPRTGVAGIAWNAARGTPLGHSFLFVMAAFGQPVLNLRQNDQGYDGEFVTGEQNRPMFDSEAARNTAEFFREILDCSPHSILTMSWYERALCYAEGKAAMAYCGTLLAPLFELDNASPAWRNTGYSPHPHGPNGWPVAPIGGYALGIPSNVSPERVNPIWTVLTSLISPSAIKMFLENGSMVSPRFSVASDLQVQNISPLVSSVDEMARSGVLQMWPRPPTPEISEIISIAGEEMHDMLLGVKSVDAALSCAQSRADTLMKKRGRLNPASLRPDVRQEEKTA